MAEVLGDGWDALRAGRWSEARDLFSRAVGDAPSPEAFEGLSWAAWWLDEAAQVFEARERAFRGYRDQGDDASAARVAIWLGADQIDFNGAVAVASGWFERAQRLLEPLEEGVEHGWLAFQQGYLSSLRGQAGEAAKLGSEAARLGRKVRVADLEMLGLALRGMSLVSRGEVSEGMRCLEEASAIALAGEATIPISSAWTCCFMVTACTRVYDFDRAFEWCDQIAKFAARYGSRYMLGFCRAEYATIHLWRGEWDKAETALEESVSAFSESRPSMVGGPMVGLAELRRRQGRPDECRRLLEEAGSGASAQLCRARLALDEEDPRTALELAERVLRNVEVERPMNGLAALEIIAHAQLKSGDLAALEETEKRLLELSDLAESAGLEARVRMIQGLGQGARGAPEGARRSIEDALDIFERCGARFDAACARAELAEALRALGRAEDAERESKKATAELLAVGAGSTPSQASSPPDVSPRELEVLGLVSEGLSNRDIADKLSISEHTVHRHVTSILRKLDVSSRTAAASMALKEGWLDHQ